MSIPLDLGIVVVHIFSIGQYADGVKMFLLLRTAIKRLLIQNVPCWRTAVYCGERSSKVNCVPVEQQSQKVILWGGFLRRTVGPTALSRAKFDSWVKGWNVPEHNVQHDAWSISNFYLLYRPPRSHEDQREGISVKH